MFSFILGIYNILFDPNGLVCAMLKLGFVPVSTLPICLLPRESIEVMSEPWLSILGNQAYPFLRSAFLSLCNLEITHFRLLKYVPAENMYSVWQLQDCGTFAEECLLPYSI